MRGATLPAAVRLPHHIFNTDGSVWPGQDAGFLGRAADPWLFRCQPALARFRYSRVHARRPISRRTGCTSGGRCSRRSNDHRAAVERGGTLAPYDRPRSRPSTCWPRTAARAAFRI